jgi:hypothetical protein
VSGKPVVHDLSFGSRATLHHRVVLPAAFCPLPLSSEEAPSPSRNEILHGKAAMRYLQLLLATALVFISLYGVAQNATTSLRGVVSDPSGASIATATVTLTNDSVGYRAAVKVDPQGQFSFQQLDPGKYTITVAAEGFAQQVLTAELLVAQPATVNVTMSITATVQSVDVSAAAETLNTTDATIGNAINNETLMELPSEGRNPQTLLALQPGVLFLGYSDNLGTSASLDSRNGVVSGARADQTNITLDGVDNNNQVTPSAFTGILRTTLDSTEEFRVTTSDANADTGRSSGGQVNLVTRSGTNEVHGAIYEYNRNNLGLANDWFVKAGQLQSGLPNRPGELIRNTYGARLGGPVRKDKIFLFGNYEGNRQNESASVARTVPTASLAAGEVVYPSSNGSLVSLTPAQLAIMDPRCSKNGTCPWGPGVDPYSLALFKLYPAPNGFTLGDGYNTGSYTFSSPEPLVQNVYIARVDFDLSDKHRFYVRGSMQNDQQAENSYYPGQPASETLTDDSKGIAANYTWTVNSNLLNNLRYGYDRQSIATHGVGNGTYTTFTGLDTPEATTRNNFILAPLNNIIDDLTWVKGKHTLEFGANYRLFTYQNSTDANSFNNGDAFASYMLNSGFAGISGSSFDPGTFGFPAVDNSFTTNYNNAVSMVAGLTNEETGNFNYQVSSGAQSANLLGSGVPVVRNFRGNEFEYYIQDTFKALPNLTVTLGIRHTILQTPYEIHGQQVQPTINMHQWFETRGQQAALGNSVQPEISFAPSGKANGGKPFYPMNWGNVAPRIAIAFAPAPEEGTWMNKLLGGAGKSSIRAGFGIYYDHYGEALIVNYSQQGSFSLSSSLRNPVSSQTADTTPRFTGLHNLPNLVPSPAGSITYPQTPSDNPLTSGFAVTTGLDDSLHTPYSEVFNLSLQRELPKSFTFEANYVGRLGRHLLQSLDLAQPLDLVDPQSGTDYYTAATALSKAYDQGVTEAAIPTVAYWEDLFPDAKGAGTNGSGAPGNTATQNIYALWLAGGIRGNETAALYDLDILCTPGCGGRTGRYWPLQYSTLFSTASIGGSSYNAGQFILRHPMSHNIQLDLSYTYSKSMDLGSDTESNPAQTSSTFGYILDAWNPWKNYAISDFNTTHLLTGDWVLRLPAGRGQSLLGGSSRLMDALVGGWSLTGITRVSSGLPFSVSDGLDSKFGTNWAYSSYMINTGPIKMRKHIDENGSPQAFDNPLTALANMREPYPGEIGERNKFIGDGYFDLDDGLHKNIRLTEKSSFQFAWEIFNVTNSVRFDPHAINSSSTSGTQLGVYSSPALVQPRRMQFSGRFEF